MFHYPPTQHFQVTKLEIPYNELEKIPEDLLLLPCLVELNISHNSLKYLPSAPEWSPSLTILDLSFNNLTSFPDAVEAPSLLVLSVAHNQFRTVPKSICSFSSLEQLDISDNQDILALPVEMGRLSHLSVLNLNNLKDLHDPPRAVHGNAEHCIRYLRQKLQNVKPFYKMKLMLVGCAERGKTTLVAALEGRELECQDTSRTVGVDVSSWKYKPQFSKPKFHFSIWDFGGQKEYYSTHQCFLSRRSMYLLVFNLTDGDNGIEEMKPWLNNIALRAPGSCVIIVGTHLDLIPSEHRSGFVSVLLQKVKQLIQGYPNLLITEVVTVSLHPPIENVSYLREVIYKNAAQYKYKGQLVMGKQIPASYHKLDNQLQVFREEVCRGKRQPIMHHEEFQAMVKQMDLGIHTEMELKTATVFLRDVGALLHYDDKRHNLHELYFIDPHWLCKVMARIVGPDFGERKHQIKDGILLKEDVNDLFLQSGSRRDQFCTKYNFKSIQQYLILLYRFELALPLDESRILVTSMLSPKRPGDIDIELSQDPPFHSRYIMFGSSETPPGFWSRYLSRIMYSVSQVSNALQLNMTMPGNLIGSVSLGLGEEECRYTTASKVKYWQSGLYLNDKDVTFRVESLSESNMKHTTKEHGILMVASTSSPSYPSDEGIRIIGQLVDMALSLLRDLYPGLTEIKQRIPCYDCVRMKRQNPYEFSAEECWLAMEEQKSTIECKYDMSDLTKNHTMVVSKIVPDMFLEDIDPKFLLSHSKIKNEQSLMTRITEYEQISQGVYCGSFVTIMYPHKSKEALSKLRSEVRILQKWQHPCLTCLKGIVVHPRIAIVMERAPENSLEWPLVTQKNPIHRITLFRIAAQVAAALKFLHSKTILFRDLKASNVLLWTLDSQSLCHCKLANYAVTSPLHSNKIKGLRGFIAPEVLTMGSDSQYNEKADIFSYGMLLYQIIGRQHPFDTSRGRRFNAVQRGEQPSLPDTDPSTMAFHYMKLAMEACWSRNPQKRPDADSLLKYMCLSLNQSVVSLIDARDGSSMRRAQVVKSQKRKDIWICSDGVDGLEIDVYNLSTLQRSKTIRISNTFGSICLCKDYIWIATRSGISKNSLEIYNPANQKREYEIKDWDSMVSCISCSNEYVYVGTMEGLCFSFPNDLKRIKQNPRPRRREFPETKPINDILPVTWAGNTSLWVSHTRYIYFVQPNTLEVEHVHYRGDTDDLVGKLCTAPNDASLVWSAHIGGTMLSAWDVGSRSMRFEVNVSKLLDDIYSRGGSSAITAIATALDTVWVGMTSGHILVFADQDLLTWYHPYSSYIQFITAIPGPGLCKTEQCLMLTGGQRFKCPIPENLRQSNIYREDSTSPGDGATMILWEAFNKKMTRQIKFIEDSDLFEDFHKMRKHLKNECLDFKDGTHILPEETFTVHIVSKEKTVFEVTCPKPLKIATLVDRIKRKINVPSATCTIEYRDSGSGECIEIRSQEDVDKYAELTDRPELMCHIFSSLDAH